MAAETTIQQIIDSAIQSAQQAQDAADRYSDDAVNAAKTRVTGASISSIGEVSIPTLTEPTDDLSDIFEGQSGSKASEIKTMVENELADFLNKYFPCGWISKLQNICEWIDDAIQNGGTGLPTAVEQAIWDRAREREGRLNERSNEEAANVPASLGWPVPSAAVVNRQMRAAQDNINRDSSLSRDVMIEQARLEQANIHFAISSGIQLHSMLMSSAINFVNAKLRAEALGQQYGQVLSTAAQNFYSQMVQYYQAQLRGEQLELRQDIATVDAELSETRIAVEEISRRARNQADAAMSAARVMGDIAASARSTTNTMASISNETTSEE
ncbi:MAG TPA: hypothetical protein VK972_02590 [Wenzhouxiangella sp.]|nr:hypothetical protein [Wenzhouxiangella sp.]